MHLNINCDKLASSSKDATIRIWNTSNQTCLVSLGNHLACVTKVLWGGHNYLYSSSEDRTIKVWTNDGKLYRNLTQHGHWVNTLAVHTDYVLRFIYIFNLKEFIKYFII